MTVAELLLFGGLAVVAYVYLCYPLLLWLVGRIRGGNSSAAPVTPSVSVVIPAHDEEDSIAAKLENTLALDYPSGKMEILVVSDGSTDATEDIAAGYSGHGVRLLRLPRCGKMRALEQSVGQARGVILVFTDANTRLVPQALRALVSHFADPEVGGVGGRKRIGKAIQGETVALGEGCYWKYDQLLKQWESRAGSTIGADGSLYAIRRELFHPPAEPALADDLAISTAIRLQGRRLVFEPAAEAWEEPPASAESEFRRKVRVTNHAMRALWELRAALNPRRTGFFAIKLWSHKLLRYFVPIPLAAALVANLALARTSVFYALLLTAQIGFYALALAGGAMRCRPAGRSPLLHVPFYFCLAHTAALLGALSLLCGTRIVAWDHGRGSRPHQTGEAALNGGAK